MFVFTGDEARIRNFLKHCIFCRNCIYGIGKIRRFYSQHLKGLQSLRENFSAICGMQDEDLSGRWDWAALRRSNGAQVRNSLLVAPILLAHFSNFRK
jgi:hypothetical protein